MKSIDPCGIYWIRNKINNKIYIGSSSNTRVRFNNHRHELRKNIHKNCYLQSAWDKYGEENFIFEILLLCHPDMLIWYEQQFLDQWKPEYNIAKLADSPGSHSISEEQRKKVSEFHKGRKRSDETRKRMSIARIGCKASDEARKNMRNSHIGKTTSNKQKETISKLSKGNAYRAKTYSGLVSPDGIIYNSVFNLSDFCRKNNLEVSNMNAVIHGKVISHRGWTYIGGLFCLA